MRLSDISRLSQPYTETDNPNQPPPDPALALGVDTPKWSALERSILEDLTTGSPYGIGWWAPYPGTSRRILISDQLYACTRSVLDNMLESGWHLLEVLDWSEKESDRLANVVRVENGRLAVRMPRPQSPLESLANQVLRLHVVGTVRALAGALDCMAGTIIGFLALPKPILRADFGIVRSLLRTAAVVPSTEGERVQANFGRRLEELIGSVGPKGWLEWALAFRNMMVHRGRRTELGQFVPRTPVVYGPDGQPALRARRVTHLPRDPGRSDVEVFLDNSNAPLLTEGDDQTLQGLLGSTKAFVEAVATELGGVWQWRKAHRDSLPQPAEQWKGGPSSESIGFSGYAPGSFDYSPEMFSTHPVVAQRMRAASLDDPSRPNWKMFD